MIQKALIISILSLLYTTSNAQKDQLTYRRFSGQTFFPSTLNYAPSGWFIAPGATKLLSNPSSSITDNIDGVDYRFNPSSKFALYAELGRYKLLKYPGFFSYYDYGLAYKRFSGIEEVEIASLTNSTHTFIDQHLTGFFNLNNVIEISNPFFIQNSFGINLNWAFSKSRSPGLNIGEQFPSPGIAQLHYKFSLGLLATKKLLLLPGIELPLLSLWPLGPAPTLQYFSSDYYPMVLSIKFIFLRNRNEVCPPVFAPGLPDGYTPGGVK